HMPYSVPTEGMTRPRSICDTRLGDTPRVRAKDLREIPCASLSFLSFNPSASPIVSARAVAAFFCMMDVLTPRRSFFKAVDISGCRCLVIMYMYSYNVQ